MKMSLKTLEVSLELFLSSETTVHCDVSSMTVVVRKSHLIQHNWDKLHLINDNGPSCNLTTHSNLTHLIAVMSLNECGTTREVGWNSNASRTSSNQSQETKIDTYKPADIPPSHHITEIKALYKEFCVK